MEVRDDGGESDEFVFEDDDSEESFEWDGQWVAQEASGGGPGEDGDEGWDEERFGEEPGAGEPGAAVLPSPTALDLNLGDRERHPRKGGPVDDDLDGSDVECIVVPSMATPMAGPTGRPRSGSAQSRPGSGARSRPESAARSRPESAARSRPSSGTAQEGMRPSSGRSEYRPGAEPVRRPREHDMSRRREEAASQLRSLWARADEGGEAAVAALCEAAALCRVRIESDNCRRAAKGEAVAAPLPSQGGGEDAAGPLHRIHDEGEGPEVTSLDLLQVYLALSRAYLSLGPDYGAQALAAALRAKKLVGPDLPAEISPRIVPEVLVVLAAAYRACGNLPDCVGSLESLLHYIERVVDAASGASRRKNATRNGRASLRIILALADANLEWGHRAARTSLKRQRLDKLRLQMRRDKWAHLDVSYKRREDKLVAALGAKDHGGADGEAGHGADRECDPDEIYGECGDCLDAAQERIEELAELAGAPAPPPGACLGIMSRRAELLAARCGARTALSLEAGKGPGLPAPGVSGDDDPCEAFIEVSLDMKRTAVEGFLRAGGGGEAGGAGPEPEERQEALGALLRLTDVHLALRQPDDALSVLAIVDNLAQRWGPGAGVAQLQRRASIARAMVARKAGRHIEVLASFQDVEALAEADLEGGREAAERRVGAKLWVAEALLEAGRHREGAAKYLEASREAADTGHEDADTIAHRARAVQAALGADADAEDPASLPPSPFSPWRVDG